MVREGAPAQATLASGQPLPDWLRFEDKALRFSSNGVPDRAFPLQVMVSVGGQRVLVAVSERSE